MNTHVGVCSITPLKIGFWSGAQAKNTHCRKICVVPRRFHDVTPVNSDRVGFSDESSACARERTVDANRLTWLGPPPLRNPSTSQISSVGWMQFEMFSAGLPGVVDSTRIPCSE